jgi:hypothetical protein
VGAVARSEDRLELVRRHDRDHAGAALSLGPLQIGPHVVELAVVTLAIPAA